MSNSDLPPQVVTGISTDASGFIRVNGVCIGRKVSVGGTVYFEVKDRNRQRSLARGAQLLRVPLLDFVEDLTKNA